MKIFKTKRRIIFVFLLVSIIGIVIGFSLFHLTKGIGYKKIESNNFIWTDSTNYKNINLIKHYVTETKDDYLVGVSKIYYITKLEKYKVVDDDCSFWHKTITLNPSETFDMIFGEYGDRGDCGAIIVIFDYGEMIVNTDRLINSLLNITEVDDETIYYKKNSLKWVYYHELGHNIWKNILSEEEKKIWLEKYNHENNFITEYSKKNVEEYHSEMFAYVNCGGKV